VSKGGSIKTGSPLFHGDLESLVVLQNRKRPRVSCVQCLVVALCISPVFADPAIAQDRESEARRHFEAGQSAQQAGSYDVAAREFQKVVAILPGAAEAYASLGLDYNANGKFAESARALSKCEALKPGLPGVDLYLGIDLVKLKEPGQAIGYLKHALRMEPANKQAWLWLSEALLESGQVLESIDQLRSANSRFPSDPVLLFRLGEAYRSAADAGIEHVILAASGKPLIHQVYGDIYKDEGLWDKAIGHYRRALADDAGWHGAHTGLGEVALRRGKLEEAASEFNRELEINPRSASTLALLGEAGFYRGRPGEALELLGRAVQIDADAAEAALDLDTPAAGPAAQSKEQNLAQMRGCLSEIEKVPASRARSLALALVHQRFGNIALSESFLTEFRSAIARPGIDKSASGNPDGENFQSTEMELRRRLQTRPDDLQASYMLARTYRNLSLTVLRQLLLVARDSYPAHQLLGETYENAEDYEKAIDEYRLVERMAPELPGIHFVLGHLLLKTGAPEQAMAEFTTALQNNPDHVGANAELGALLIEREDPRKGIAYLKKAVGMEPNLWAAHRDLGQAYAMQKDFELAEVELQKAIDHDRDGSTHYQLGMVYRALGRPDAAKRVFARSREIKADQLADANAARALPEASQP
jgi:tetratricopeptide (TPR) repeat protein